MLLKNDWTGCYVSFERLGCLFLCTKYRSIQINTILDVCLGLKLDHSPVLLNSTLLSHSNNRPLHFHQSHTLPPSGTHPQPTWRSGVSRNQRHCRHLAASPVGRRAIQHHFHVGWFPQIPGAAVHHCSRHSYVPWGGFGNVSIRTTSWHVGGRHHGQ